MHKPTSVILLMSLWAGAVWADTAPKPDPAAEYFAQVSQLASKGDVASEVCLGKMYGLGFGVKKDVDKQFYWASAAADKGSDAGKLDVAKSYAWGIGVQQDPKKALAMVRELVAKGYAPAETTLGVLYVSGSGVTLDSGEGVRWFKEAAEAGDFEGMVRLALMYHWGTGVKSDAMQAHIWLDKAAQHKSDCAAEFIFQTPFIINGYLGPNSIDRKTPRGAIGIKFIYKDGKAENVTLLKSSGNTRADNAWLQAVQDAKLPPWPDNYKTDDKTLSAWIPGFGEESDPGFSGAVKAAIQAAEVFPKDVLVNGSKGTGNATVEFDYLDGSASGGKITVSSGEPSEDAAALAAVADAKYPATPQNFAHKKIHMSVTLEFQKISPPQAATSPAPSAATH